MATGDERHRPDVVVIMTDQERAPTPYEDAAMRGWRQATLTARRWFDEHGVAFDRHYTGSLACVPSRPTLFTGQYPDVHGVTQTDGLGKDADDTAMRWLRPDEVPTLGHWFRASGYDTHYVGKWHLSHADLVDPVTGGPLATNDDDGVVDDVAVRAYLDADVLDEFGFSGWIGPEPHGAKLADSGLRRDPLTADRAVAWLHDRHRRRRAGDGAAARPFLLVVSFVNPHDIVLFPAWVRNDPLPPDPFATPDVPPAPTADEDLDDKPAAQRAYRAAYPTGYAPIAGSVYTEHAARYRREYHRFHAEVDRQIDRVRRAVTAGRDDAHDTAHDTARDTVLVLTSDHGELLGAHGGLHQKWFNLYDEATRVPFTVVRLGTEPTQERRVVDMATSHVDLVPTLLAAAGVDVDQLARQLTDRFGELHPFPGRDLSPVIAGGDADPGRVVYLMTRDNILEGDTGASVVARALGLGADPPADLRIEVPADVGSGFEAIVARHAGCWWKLVRTFDDPATWTEPFVRHLAADGTHGVDHPSYRTSPLPDEWELYDLDGDPCEARNRWSDETADAARDRLVAVLESARASLVPPRHVPWPYAIRRRAST